MKKNKMRVHLLDHDARSRYVSGIFPEIRSPIIIHMTLTLRAPFVLIALFVYESTLRSKDMHAFILVALLLFVGRIRPVAFQTRAYGIRSSKSFPTIGQ